MRGRNYKKKEEEEAEKEEEGGGSGKSSHCRRIVVSLIAVWGRGEGQLSSKRTRSVLGTLFLSLSLSRKCERFHGIDESFLLLTILRGLNLLCLSEDFVLTVAVIGRKHWTANVVDTGGLITSSTPAFGVDTR